MKIIWTRGAKKIDTKKRLLSDTAQTSVFDEKYEVTTSMDIDASGKPTRAKMVSRRLGRNNMFFLINYSLNSWSLATKLTVFWARRTST